MNLVKWLSNQNYKSTRNISLGGKLPDLIGHNNSEILAFEEKKYAEELPNAIGQCLHYLTESNKAFIVLPKEEIERIHPNTLEILKKYGIGLLEKSKNMRTVIDASFFENSTEKIFDKINSQKQISKKKRKIEINLIPVNRKDIINLLSEYPNGLTIQEIATNLGASRHTVSKYVFLLTETGTIEQHEVGRAKFCFLKKGGRR